MAAVKLASYLLSFAKLFTPSAESTEPFDANIIKKYDNPKPYVQVLEEAPKPEDSELRLENISKSNIELTDWGTIPESDYPLSPPQEYSEKEIKDFVVNIYKATVHLFPTLPSYNINLDGKNGEENVTVTSNDIGEGKKKIELLLSYYRLENTRSSSGRILVNRKSISITLDGDEATLDENEFDKNEIKYLPDILKEVRK